MWRDEWVEEEPPDYDYTRADAAWDALYDELKREYPNGYMCEECEEESCDLHVEDNSFDYEYHGISGTHNPGDSYYSQCCGAEIVSVKGSEDDNKE